MKLDHLLCFLRTGHRWVRCTRAGCATERCERCGHERDADAGALALLGQVPPLF